MLSSSGRKTFRALVLSLTQSVFVPTGVVVAVVELIPDDVGGDEVQAANVMAARAMVSHNSRVLKPYIEDSFAASRTAIRRNFSMSPQRGHGVVATDTEGALVYCRD